MLPIDPSRRKPPPRALEVLANLVGAFLETLAVAALTCCYDVVVVIVAFISLVLTEARRSKSPSLEWSGLILLTGALLGGLLASCFAVRGHYWRALGVVLGLIPLIWFAQTL